LNEFVRVVNLVFEQQEACQLASHVFADTHDVELGVVFVEVGVVHREVDDLLVVDNSDELGTREEWFFMFNGQKVPLALCCCREVCN